MLSDDDSASESSDSELKDKNEETPLDYTSDESDEYFSNDDPDPEWNLFEEAAENEESGDDEENSDTPASRNDVR